MIRPCDVDRDCVFAFVVTRFLDGRAITTVFSFISKHSVFHLSFVPLLVRRARIRKVPTIFAAVGTFHVFTRALARLFLVFFVRICSFSNPQLTLHCQAAQLMYGFRRDQAWGDLRRFSMAGSGLWRLAFSRIVSRVVLVGFKIRPPKLRELCSE
jgi:hypothetical protein